MRVLHLSELLPEFVALAGIKVFLKLDLVACFSIERARAVGEQS